MNLFAALLLLQCLTAQEAAPSAASQKVAEPQPTAKATISYGDAALLGLVEGLTEYLPVSSTGHLILANRFLGLDADTPLLNARGETVFVEGENDLPEPFTLRKAADGYSIIIQGGAILAVVFLYFSRLLKAANGGLGMGVWAAAQVIPSLKPLAARFAAENLLLARNLAVAFLPAAVLGFLLDDLIESFLFGVWPVVAALVAGSVLMFIVEARRTRKSQTGTPSDEGPDLHELTLGQCLTVGFLQCVAMWPGTSRSMMTLVGGYLIKLSPGRAAEFSFLLGFITLTAASGYKTLKIGGPLLETIDIGPILLGMAVATVAAALAIVGFVSFLTRFGLTVFALYRLLLAAVVAVLMLS